MNRPQVLIPSDNRDFVFGVAEGYARLGWDPIVGVSNFDLEAGNPVLFHLQWPEELTGWKPPSASVLSKVLGTLDRWAARTKILMSVHNLHPHRNYGHPAFRALYEGCFQRADVIHHFSNASKELVCKEYPVAAGRHHVVRLGFNFERMLPHSRNRTVSRKNLGIEPDEFSSLVFGDLRSWSEVRLIEQGVSRARIRNKRLIAAVRLYEDAPRWKAKYHQLQWRVWQQRHNVVSRTDYIPDDDVHHLFDAADAVIVARLNPLNSGVLNLAMTLGRFVIAPNIGAIPEFLSGTDNLLYDPNTPDGLQLAIERAAEMDRERIGIENHRIAAAWQWPDILSACLANLPHERSLAHRAAE